MELRKAVKLQQDALLRSLQESIRICSEREAETKGCPFGPGARHALDHALETARQCGFQTVDLDHYMGWCEYGQGTEMIAVLGHLDVVPAGDGWSVDPFGGEIRDGKIFGRGTTDDKGPTFAALYALKAIKDAGLPLSKRIRILFGTNEETGSADMKYYLSHGGEQPQMGFTPDGEYPVINGEKGIVNATFHRSFSQDGQIRLIDLHGGTAHNVVPAHATAELKCPPEAAEKLAARTLKKIVCKRTKTGVRVEASGVEAHGSTPERGENAIGRLMQALDTMNLPGELGNTIRFLAEKIGMESDGSSLGAAMEDEISGKLTFNLGTIEGNAEGITLQVNYRYPVTCRFEDCAPTIQAAFASAGFEMTAHLHKHSLYMPADSELVQKLLKVYADQTGLPAEPKSIGGGTYAKTVPNIVAFGPIFPGDEVREHKSDEFIEVEKLMKNAQIYASALYELAK